MIHISLDKASCEPTSTEQCIPQAARLEIGAPSGWKVHLKLSIGSRPIANKHCEGKMKMTLKRELTVPEIAEREANAGRPPGGGARRQGCICIYIYIYIYIFMIIYIYIERERDTHIIIHITYVCVA